MAQRKKASIKPKTSSPQKLHTKYILLVEDEPAHAAAIRHVLRSANPNVLVKVAGSLQEYRNAIAISSPEIVLMDINLPDGKALDVLTSPPEAGSFPIVVMTSYGDEKIAVKAMKAGALDYVVKSPEAFKAMPRTLERALREWKLLQERKRAEEVLRDSEELYHSFISASPEAIMIIGTDGKISYVSPRGLEMYRYKDNSEVLGHSPLEWIFPEDHEKALVNIANAFNGNFVPNDQYHLRRKDGSEFYGEINAALLLDSEKKPTGLMAVTRDITDRKRAEESLKESELQLSSIYDTVGDVIFHLAVEAEEKYRFISINQAFCNVTGLSRKQVVDKMVNEVIPEPSLSMVLGKYRQAIEENSIIRWEETSDYSTGRLIGDVSIAPVVDNKGHCTNLVGSVHDITERKRAEEALWKSEERYRRITEGLTDYLYTVRVKDGQVVETKHSRTCEAVTGYTIEEFAADPYLWISMVVAEERAQVIERVQKILAGEKIPPIEHRIVRKDGQIRWVSDTPILHMDFQGKLVSYDGVIKDITERKQAEKALRKSEEQYRLLFETMAQGVVYQNREGLIISANPAAERILGLTIDQMMGRTSIDPRWKSIHENGIDFPGDQHPSMMALKTGKPIENVIMGVNIPCENLTRWILISAIPQFLQDDPVPYRVYTTFTDITERKRTEDALRESEERYRILFSEAREAIFIADAESGTILDCNEVACSLIERPKEEMIGKHQSILHPPNELVGEFTDSFRRHVTDEKGHVLNSQVVSKSGTLKDVEIKANILNIQGKKIVQAFFNDITDRKRTEEVLEAQYALLNALINSASDIIIFSLDKNCCYTTFNEKHRKEMKRVWNTDIKIGMNLLDCMQMPELRELAKQSIDRALKGESFSEIQHQPNLNIYYEFSWNPIHQKEEIVGVTVFIRDITERKRAEETLRALSIRQEAILSAVPDIIMEVDNNKTYTWANQAGRKFFGDDVIGKEANFYFEGDQDTYNVVQPLFNGDKNVIYIESWQRRKDGEKRLLAWWCRVLKDTTGKISGALSSARDITERKRTEENLRQMQKLEGLGTLAGGIAHDFNNILGIILAYISGIEGLKGDAKKLDLAVETITKAVQRGKTLVQQILTFARKTETEFGAVNVNDVVMEIMTMIFETFPKILTYGQNVDKGISYINADRSQLYQVLLNLCVNARDAMPNGGLLSINTRMVSVESLRNQYPDAAASSYVCIEVIDTGEGMTEEIQKRIFEPFFTTKGIGKGTGLGLAVVFGVVQSHKGFIDVESELGKGTTFRLYLPASQVTAPISVKDEETLEEIPGGTETLLIVEDEEMLMASLRMMLVEKGYKVLAVGDGLTALKIYQEKKNDIALVLTDLGLPDITGLEVCQRIKQIKSNERMILATGFLDPDMKSEFLKAGIQYFLYKPYDLKKVLKVVREVLDGK